MLHITVLEPGDVATTFKSPVVAEDLRYYISDGEGGLKEVDFNEAHTYQQSHRREVKI